MARAVRPSQRLYRTVYLWSKPEPIMSHIFLIYGSGPNSTVHTTQCVDCVMCPSVVGLSVCLRRYCTLCSNLKFSTIFLHHLIASLCFFVSLFYFSYRLCLIQINGWMGQFLLKFWREKIQRRIA